MIERRGLQTGLSTFVMLLFGSPFVGIGIFMTLVGTHVAHVNPRSVHAPYWVLLAAGLSFGCGGLMLWSMAWKQFQANRRRVVLQAGHVNEPALEDYDWDPHGFRSHCWTRVAKALTGVGFFAIFLSMFNWWAWFAAGPFMVKVIVSLFDLILIFVGWQVVMVFSRAIKFGNSRIEFVDFPYRTNEQIVVRWFTPPGIHRANKGTFTLRCVKEWTETTGSSGNRSQSIVHEEQWNGVWTVNQPEEFSPGRDIEFAFNPPAGVPATCLSGAPTYFWEFEVDLDLPGPDFKESYLVPVY